ncbi:MAG: hypothetical protein AMJ61_04830, partial [Desulfobacterales bacterium SG8_35_2]
MGVLLARFQRVSVWLGFCLLVLFCFSNTPAYALDVFVDDFEGGQGDWFADNGVWQIGTPTAGPASCFEGSQCMGTILDGNYPPDTDSPLISPVIDLPTLVSVD